MVPPKLHGHPCHFTTSNAGQTPPFMSRGAREWRVEYPAKFSHSDARHQELSLHASNSTDSPSTHLTYVSIKETGVFVKDFPGFTIKNQPPKKEADFLPF